MDKTKIISFLNYENKLMTNKFIVPILIVNTFIFYLGAYFSANRLVNCIISTIINILAIVSYAIIHRKINWSCQYTRKMIHGVYFFEFSISCNYAAYQLMKESITSPILLSLSLVSITIITGVCICFTLKYNIKKGNYINKNASKHTVLIFILGGIVISLMTIYRINADQLSPSFRRMVFGIILLAMAMTSMAGINPIMKYYYYKRYICE